MLYKPVRWRLCPQGQAQTTWILYDSQTDLKALRFYHIASKVV